MPPPFGPPRDHLDADHDGLVAGCPIAAFTTHGIQRLPVLAIESQADDTVWVGIYSSNFAIGSIGWISFPVSGYRVGASRFTPPGSIPYFQAGFGFEAFFALIFASVG